MGSELIDVVLWIMVNVSSTYLNHTEGGGGGGCTKRNLLKSFHIGLPLWATLVIPFLFVHHSLVCEIGGVQEETQ